MAKVRAGDEPVAVVSLCVSGSRVKCCCGFEHTLYSSHACTHINVYHPALPLGAVSGHIFLSAGYHRAGPAGFG